VFFGAYDVSPLLFWIGGSTSAERVGTVVRAAGRIDGDVFTHLGVTTPTQGPFSARGRAAHTSGVTDAHLRPIEGPPSSSNALGSGACNAGDVDNDGFAGREVSATGADLAYLFAASNSDPLTLFSPGLFTYPDPSHSGSAM